MCASLSPESSRITTVWKLLKKLTELNIVFRRYFFMGIDPCRSHLKTELIARDFVTLRFNPSYGYYLLGKSIDTKVVQPFVALGLYLG